MIRLSDATKLAATKLRTRKVRLIVTVVIAGLLFSALATASLVSRGAFDSLASFNKEGFGQRYIVSAIPQSNIPDYTRNPDVIDRAIAINKDIVARKVIEAKRLGLEYSPKDEPQPFEKQDNQRSLKLDHSAARQALNERFTSLPVIGQAQLQKQASGYAPIAFYENKRMPYGLGSSSLKLLKDGKEVFDADAQPGTNGFAQTGIEAFTSQWGLLSRDLLQPFVLPGASTFMSLDGSIPVVAPFSASEQLMGLKALPASAEPAKRLDRLQQVRKGAQQITFQVCYRNQTSVENISKTVAMAKELELNKNKKDYEKPSLIYGLPAQPCAVPTVIRDVRTAVEKKTAAGQDQFDQLFGKLAPQQAILKFHIIGVAPDPPDFNTTLVSSLVSSIISSDLLATGSSWFTPIELLDPVARQPLLDTIFSSQDALSESAGATTGHFVEMANAASARSFLDEQTCQPDFAGISSRDDLNAANPFASCERQAKHFMLQPFGSNSLAIDQIKQSFTKVFTIAALAVAVMAAIIMIGTVGRTIADSRRETAVFRAIGAKKVDIVLIYIIYTLFLSVMIFTFALLVGLLAAQFVSAKYSAELTIQSLVAYNAQDIRKTYELFSFYLPDMVRLLSLSLLGGILSAFLPLIRNLRRNPIRDMRDDT